MIRHEQCPTIYNFFTCDDALNVQIQPEVPHLNHQRSKCFLPDQVRISLPAGGELCAVVECEYALRYTLRRRTIGKDKLTYNKNTPFACLLAISRPPFPLPVLIISRIKLRN